MDEIQQKQEDQYAFPYHYIPLWGTRFTQTRTMRWGYEYASYMELVVDLLHNKIHPKKLIDVGCGDGRLVYEVRKHFPGVNVSGVDYSERAIAFAKAFNPEMTFHIGDVTDKSFTIGKFDTITLIETLEHIPPETIKKFVEGLHRLLETDGRLVLTVPCSNLPVSKNHYQHFTRETLEETLSPYFVIEECLHLNKISFVQKIIKLFLTNRFFALTQYRTQNALYNFYKEHFLYASSGTAGRLCMVCKKLP